MTTTSKYQARLRMCRANASPDSAFSHAVAPRRGRMVARRAAGFSLLELLAVVAILGIIALVAIPRIGISAATARENACFQNKSQINRAVEKYLFENGSLPATIADIDTPGYFPDGIPNCPVSANAYTLDPTTKRVVNHDGGGKGGGH